MVTSGIAGFQAGNPKYGIITGFIFFIIVSLSIALTNIETFYDYLYIAPFSVIICVATGYFGGLLQDRRKLYPLV